MRIQAKLVMGDVVLDLDAEVPPGERVVTLTNAPPYCLIIPRDRLPLSALGFSIEVREELERRGVRTVGDVLGLRGFTIRLRDLSTAAEAELQNKMAALEQASLLEEGAGGGVEEETTRGPTVPFPVPEEEPREPDQVAVGEEVAIEEGAESGLPREVADSALLSELYLPETTQRALQARGIRTVQELCGKTRAALVMTPGLTRGDVEFLESRLRRAGRMLMVRGLAGGGGGNGTAKPAAPAGQANSVGKPSGDKSDAAPR